MEIGTFNGYSSLWLALFAKKVFTLEIDIFIARIAKENFKKAKCENIKLIEGDALENLKKINKKFDIILIDAKKSEYKDYLNLVLNLISE